MYLTVSSQDQDDFEVVPQFGEDVDMWDAANDDEDALKQAHIKSLEFHRFLVHCYSLLPQSMGLLQQRQ